MIENVADLERVLRRLLTGDFTDLRITFNDDHACLYMDARTFYEDLGNDYDTDWVSPEEREKALETNSVWECVWYPRTPVLFYRAKASSLEALIANLEARVAVMEQQR